MTDPIDPIPDPFIDSPVDPIPVPFDPGDPIPAPSPPIDPPVDPTDHPTGPPVAPSNQTPEVTKIINNFWSKYGGLGFTMYGIEIENIEPYECPNSNAIAITNADNPVDDQIVIVNPPILVPDPAGSIIISGMRFREDPLAAIAQVVRDYGGAS